MIDMNALGDLIEQRIRKVLEERDAKKPVEISAGPDLVSIPRASEMTGYHPQTIRAWLNDGKIRRHGGKGKLARISRAELLAYLATLGSNKPTKHESASAIAERILQKRAH